MISVRIVVISTLLFVGSAMAQTSDDKGTGGRTIGAGERSENLPTPKSDNDPAPPVASPGTPEGGVVKQAGIGGEVAYGRAGVVELGGSAGVSNSNSQFTASLNPSIGWFFQDNLELSGIINLSYVSVAGTGSMQMAVLAEPSYHIPFSQQVFGFLGVGVGLGYQTVGGFGFALAPRLGANIMVGRSGILTPALFGNYSTVGVTPSATGTTLQINLSYGLQIGYTVML